MKDFNPNPAADINSTYSPSEGEAKVREHVYKRYHEMKQGREPHEKGWERYEKQWEGLRESNGEWNSDIVAQLSTSIVETLMAEVQQYDVETPIKAGGYEDVPKVEVMKRMIEHTKNIGDFRMEEEDIKKDAFIYGSGFGEELYWVDKREVRFAKQKINSNGEKEVFMDTRTTNHFKGAYFEHVPIWDLWFDEAAKTINRGRRQANDSIRRYIMPYEGAINFIETLPGAIRENLKYVRPGGDTNYYQYYQPVGRIDKDTEIELLFYTAKRPDALWIVANDVVVAEGPNIYNHKMLPYAQAFDIKRTNSIYHKGEMELLESIQEELTKIKRARMDRLHLTIDPMYFISRRENINESELMARPHGAIEVDDPNNIRENRVSDTPQSAYKEEESLLNEAQRATGVDDGSQAIQRTSLTATEFAGLRESTLRKVALKLWHIQNGLHIEFTRLRVSNILQFYTKPEYEKVLGDKQDEMYQEMVSQYRAVGDIEEREDGEYLVKYPQIRTENQKISFSKGKLNISDQKGDHFFTVKPEYMIPFHNSYDIVYTGSPEIPLTKTLRITKLTEYFDRMIPLILSGLSDYDPMKMMDWYTEETQGIDPDRFKVQQQETAPGSDTLQLAMAENGELMRGKALPPTAMAIPQHTQIHTAFMKSKNFQQLDPNDPQQKAIIDAFTSHVVGEQLAQEHRGGNGESNPEQVVPPTPPGNQDGMTPPGSTAGSSPIAGIMRRATNLLGGK